MFQDYSIDDYKKACYIILRPDLTPEYFIRHFGMSRYEYSICQQRLKELQKFYGIEYHFEENRIHWTVTDEKQFQQHYKGMWSFYNRHRRNLTNRSELVRGLYIARKILLANDHTDLDAVSETMVFPAAICAMQSNFAAPFCKVITSGWKTRPITECTLWATNGTSGAV